MSSVAASPCKASEAEKVETQIYNKVTTETKNNSSVWLIKTYNSDTKKRIIHGDMKTLSSNLFCTSVVFLICVLEGARVQVKDVENIQQAGY